MLSRLPASAQTRRLLALSVSVAISQMALAQTQPAPQENKEDKKALDLERVVVTATATQGSKMKQSLAVSTMDTEQIQATQAASAAEVLRAIPGIRSESSGGEGNTNITVRGAPISAGGSRYVQLQENGLPIMLFGDVAFATSDMFLRIDNSLDQLQVVRGGSASTLATNSPGGVINFITKTGIDKGGSVGVGLGVDFNQQRVDFDYGSGLSSSGSSWHVGGHIRTGEGARPSGERQEKGGQLQASFSQAFRGGSFRVYAKYLDDQTPTYLPVPVRTVNGLVREVPGVDPRTYTPYGRNWPLDPVLNKDNSRSLTDVNDGLSVKATSLGGELMLDLGNGFKLENRARFSNLSGRFTGVFPWGDLTPGTYTIQSGPDKGKSWTGLATNATIFNTSIDDMGSFSNDLKLTKSIALADKARLDLTGGLFYNQQKVELTWNFNQYVMQVVNENPALLGNAKYPTGVIGFGAPEWGYCCQRAIDAKYTTASPYFAVAYEAGPLNLDASVRFDRQSASGSRNRAVNNGTQYVAANAAKIDYDKNNTSFSLGSNFRVSRDLAVFGRYSEGAAFKADRLWGDDYTSRLSGEVAIDKLKQAEVGIKARSGNLSAFVTLFNARTNESNYEATTQISTVRSYRANGVEVEAAYLMGDFRLAGGLTLTDAKITAANDPTVVGNKPRRQARVVYQLSPSYSFGALNVGASLIGTGKSFGDDSNTITQNGFAVINAFANYEVRKNLVVGVGVNNLTNRIGYTEVEGDGHAARSINGRTVKATLKYTF
ncbi:MAG: TonB-dependent receptor [Burkholderiales bacterium]|nr:MAG: TonB-dependent receptor [Burkholderiales bacterium]TAG82345.1 MAG: TonB-dependent receptor [Betaproteobacteria bacterium]